VRCAAGFSLLALLDKSTCTENVGNNVAGMGSDLFGSFGEAFLALLVQKYKY
jgi:hypothetical protein